MKKRKETTLEKGLIEKGYKLERKTYCGTYSQKIAHYVYIKETNQIEYLVFLNRQRDHIDSCAFSTKFIPVFDELTMEKMWQINEDFKQELDLIKKGIEDGEE